MPATWRSTPHRQGVLLCVGGITTLRTSVYTGDGEVRRQKFYGPKEANHANQDSRFDTFRDGRRVRRNRDGAGRRGRTTVHERRPQYDAMPDQRQLFDRHLASAQRVLRRLWAVWRRVGHRFWW